MSGAVRLTAAAGVTVFLTRSCAFFAAAGCAGAPLIAAVDVVPLSDTAGAWQPVASEVAAPPGSASALCSFDLTTPEGDAFSGALDDLELVRVGTVIFADGFESGDVSAWSAAVP